MRVLNILNLKPRKLNHMRKFTRKTQFANRNAAAPEGLPLLMANPHGLARLCGTGT